MELPVFGMSKTSATRRLGNGRIFRCDQDRMCWACSGRGGSIDGERIVLHSLGYRGASILMDIR